MPSVAPTSQLRSILQRRLRKVPEQARTAPVCTQARTNPRSHWPCGGISSRAASRVCMYDRRHRTTLPSVGCPNAILV